MRGVIRDIFRQFIEELREIIKNNVEDRWMNKNQLAEYWGVSTKWIENHQ